MGTSNRSKAFQDVAWQNLADAGFPDRILWHKAAAAKYPAYDITRVGIYGGSAGGQSALGALLFHPEVYKVAVSYVGCHDNRMDKLWWNEQWMGWPIGPQYSKASNVDNAHLLQGKVLLVAAELDTNVDPSSTMQVVNALIKANKTFDLLIIPGGSHGAGRTAEHPDTASASASTTSCSTCSARRHPTGISPRRARPPRQALSKCSRCRAAPVVDDDLDFGLRRCGGFFGRQGASAH